MPRKNLQRSDRFPYHVTARANNKEKFHLDRQKLWMVIGSECLTLRLIYGVEFHSFLLMPNHLHMILTVPEHDLGVVMNIFMSNVTRRVNILSDRSGHVFGGPYYWSMITSNRYFGHALKYIYRNPVRAKLCDRVEDYYFSTLPGLIGSACLPFPIHYTRSLFEVGLPLDDSSFLEWLNKPFPKEAEALIQKGLRRKTFESILSRKSRKPNILAELL